MDGRERLRAWIEGRACVCVCMDGWKEERESTWMEGRERVCIDRRERETVCVSRPILEPLLEKPTEPV